MSTGSVLGQLGPFGRVRSMDREGEGGHRLCVSGDVSRSLATWWAGPDRSG